MRALDRAFALCGASLAMSTLASAQEIDWQTGG